MYEWFAHDCSAHRHEQYVTVHTHYIALELTSCHVIVQTEAMTHTHTHTHPFNSPLSGTTWVNRYQKGKTNLDFAEARDSEWQWHQLGHMQVCT